MRKITMGYLIEYSEKTSFSGDYSERRKAICTQQTLIKALNLKLVYIVWNAVLINIEDYKINHPEEILEELT